MTAPCGAMCIEVQNIRKYYWPESFRLLSSPVGLQGEASPGTGERKRDRMCVTGAGRPRRWWHGSQGGPRWLRLRAVPGVASSGGHVTDRRDQFSLARGSARYTGQRMAWRFRKSLKLGLIRLNLSKSGVGYSIGGRGFRVGQDAKGRSYTAASIPGTGLYSREYSSQDHGGLLQTKNIEHNLCSNEARMVEGLSDSPSENPSEIMRPAYPS